MAGTTTPPGGTPTPAGGTPRAAVVGTPMMATVTGGGTEPLRKDTDKRKNNARGLLNIPAARKH